SNLNFILTVYADPSAANGEDIAVLSPVEALSLGLALSLDSAAAGFGAGMMVTHLPLTILLSLLLNTAAVLLGSFLGRTLAKRSSLDLSWLSGLLLMGLALGKLL
ncbi:MAG: manganese efflux pump, partial [Clostridium sp.]